MVPKATDYFVVIDACSVGKAVWVLYDYTPVSELGSREPVPLADLKSVFEGVDRPFDAAQLLASLDDWNDQLTVGSMEDLVNKTAIITNATVTAATVEEYTTG